MAGTVRCTRRSLGSTCLSSVRDEREYVRPRQQQLEGCSASSWLPPRFARSTTTKVGRNPWEPVESHARSKKRKKNAAPWPIFHRIEGFDSISLGRGASSIYIYISIINCTQRNEKRKKGFEQFRYRLTDRRTIYAIPPPCYSIIPLSRLFKR